MHVTARTAPVAARLAAVLVGALAVRASRARARPAAAASASPSSPAGPGAGSTAPVVAPPQPPAVVLAPVAVAGSIAPVPTTEALAAELGPLLRSPALGGRTAISVVDAATGTELYESFGGRAQAPASTLKVLTALAALRALGPDARLATRVVVGEQPSRLVLVGGGDQTLTRAAGTGPTVPGQNRQNASLDELATRVVAALGGRTKVSLRFDDTLFTGPRTAPGWPASYVASGVVSPVGALAADGGRTGPGAMARSADPGEAAAQYFASRLRAAGVTVRGEVTRDTVTASARQVAEVLSAPVSDLVERMLTLSDNDLAEALAHLAGAQQGDGSFAGGVAAVTTTLAALGVDPGRAVVRDGSGLSLQDSVPSSVLAHALAAAAVAGPATARLWPVFSGLPVAGLTGTLTYRFGGAEAGRGVVRAKTGTLTGVVGLAGSVRDAGGRLLTFAVLADQVVDRTAAEAQLDRVAATLAS